MGRSIYCSRKLSIFLIFVLLFQSLSSSIISVASAEELINNYTDNLYFTEKGQNERIQEFKVENQVISLDLVLQEGQDTDTKSKLQLPEGLSLKLDNPLQEGLTYDENTQTVFVDWTKFTALEQKKRVSLTFTSSLSDNVSIQAKTEREDQIYYSQPLNIVPVSSEPASTAEESTGDIETDSTTSTSSDKPVKRAVTTSASSEPASTAEETGDTETDSTTSTSLDKPVEKAVTTSVSASAAGTFSINNTDSYGINSVNGVNTIYQFSGTDPSVVVGSLEITDGVNGVAVSKDGIMYFSGSAGMKLYSIDGTGKVTFLSDLQASSNTATIIGNRYYYGYSSYSKLYYIDVNTKASGSIDLVTSSGEPLTGLGADMVADSDGYIWFSQAESLIQVNPGTSEILRTLPVPGLSDVIVRGMSFLPDGKILISGNINGEEGHSFTIDADGKLTSLGVPQPLPEPIFMGILVQQ